MIAKMKLKKGDMVIVNSGADKGKKGTIIAISRKDNKVITSVRDVKKKDVINVQFNDGEIKAEVL